jgi:L-cysteine desulfidase
MTHSKITKLLHDEMIPVTGCTGPTAYALAAANCRKYVTGKIKAFRVFVSPAYLKMGFGVATPGTTKTGIEIATAAGFIGGDPDLGMQVLKNTTDADIAKAARMCEEGIISVFSATGEKGVYVRNEIETDCEIVLSVVAHTHDGLVMVQVNGEDIFKADQVAYEDRIEHHPDSLSLDDMFQYANTCSMEEVGFLLDGYQVNLALAEDGIRGGYGLKTGRALLKRSFAGREEPEDLFECPLNYLPESMAERINILVCGASDGRMGGSRLPAVAAMGDGNQGLTLLLPIGVAGEAEGKSELEKARAMALGALMLIYVKARVGRAAAMCLCAIAASAGVAAGYGYLRGLSEAEIKGAVKNVISPLAGMLCDGAKNACALKMSIAASGALQSVDLAELGVEAGYYDGVCDDALEDTVNAITQIAGETMDLMDDCMVRVILKKTKPTT